MNNRKMLLGQGSMSLRIIRSGDILLNLSDLKRGERGVGVPEANLLSRWEEVDGAEGNAGGSKKFADNVNGSVPWPCRLDILRGMPL